MIIHACFKNIRQTTELLQIGKMIFDKNSFFRYISIIFFLFSRKSFFAPTLLQTMLHSMATCVMSENMKNEAVKNEWTQYLGNLCLQQPTIFFFPNIPRPCCLSTLLHHWFCQGKDRSNESDFLLRCKRSLDISKCGTWKFQTCNWKWWIFERKFHFFMNTPLFSTVRITNPGTDFKLDSVNRSDTIFQEKTFQNLAIFHVDAICKFFRPKIQLLI